MNDYISRKTAIDDLREILNDPNCPLFISATVYQILESIPAANVKPVVYAEWDFYDCCTNCGEEADYNWERGIHFYSDFCPNCGADMRGKKGKEDE